MLPLVDKSENVKCNNGNNHNICGSEMLNIWCDRSNSNYFLL